jgi:hypothetical protein
MSKRQPVIPRAHDGFDANRHGYIKRVPHGNAVKAGWRYAYNLKRISVQSKPFAHNRWIPAKIPLPECKTDVRSTEGAARLVITWPEQAPYERLNTQHTKKLPADAQSLGVVDLAAGCQIE